LDPLRRQRTNPQIERLLKAINLLRVLDREMPASVIATFLYVASHDNCHKQAMEEDINQTVASGSRNTDWLAQYHRLNKPGMNLITKEQDPTNRRRLVLRLTPKGKDLVNQLEDILYGDQNLGPSP